MKILNKSLHLLLATVAAATASGNIDKALPNNDVDKVDDDHHNKLRVSLSENKGVVDVKEEKDITITPLNSSGKLRALHLNDDEEDDFGLGQRMAKRGKRSKRDCPSDDDDDVCSISTFMGTYFYNKGCNDMSFAVDISCEEDEEHCWYHEESQNGECAFESYMVNLHDYVKYDEEEGACVLGLPVMPLKPPEGFEGEQCAKNHPNGLSARIVAVDSGHDDDMPADNLEIYFSDNYGEDFYNADTPREASRQHNGVFNRRGLLKVKEEEGTEEEKGEEDKAEVDESLSSSPVQSLEGRKLLAAFHEESRRRLCGLGEYDPAMHRCWKRIDGSYCYDIWTCKGPCSGSRAQSEWNNCIGVDTCTNLNEQLCDNWCLNGSPCEFDTECNSGYCDMVNQVCSSDCSSDQLNRGPDCSCKKIYGETYTRCGMYDSTIQLYCQDVPFYGTRQALVNDPRDGNFKFYERCTESAAGIDGACAIVTDTSLGASRPCSWSFQICDTINWNSCDKFHQLTCAGKCVNA